MKAEASFALVVAHPGHELRVFHWLELHRPVTCCLTDGSGGGASSRLASTTALLESVGAKPGAIYGRYSDRETYALLLAGRQDAFVELAIDLASMLVASGVSGVAGDAAEGFNPVHDVCRFAIDGAVAAVHERTGRVLENLEFALEDTPDVGATPESAGAVRLELDDVALQRKMQAALAYRDVQEDVQIALQSFGPRAFAVEHLRPAATGLATLHFERELPAYERYGEYRVREGRYRDVIRYREHVLPVLRAIERGCRI